MTLALDGVGDQRHDPAAFAPTGIRSPDRPARSESLYRLLCPGPYAIRRVQINQNAFKLNGTHQLLGYVDDVNKIGGTVRTIKKHREAFLVGGKEIVLKVNADKTKYMVTCQDQNAGRNHNIKIPSKGWKTSNILEQP